MVRSFHLLPTIKSRKVKNSLTEVHDIKAKIKEGKKKTKPEENTQDQQLRFG